jgi:hypothetical protein
VFAAPLNVEIGRDQEWHWAIVQAKGYPPQQNVAQQNGRQQSIPEQAAGAGVATTSATTEPSQDAPAH